MCEVLLDCPFPSVEWLKEIQSGEVEMMEPMECSESTDERVGKAVWVSKERWLDEQVLDMAMLVEGKLELKQVDSVEIAAG
jgi:hypothetical protein